MSRGMADAQAAATGIQARLLASLGDAGASAAFTLQADLELPGEGITAIFGASGSGKTSLLRCIAGLQNIESGFLHVNGETWHEGERSLPTHQRRLGFVFQEASLFEHLSAGANLDYAIRRAGPASMTRSLSQIRELMDIDPLLDKKPAQLSGGERQRVAIARALLSNPRLLLMDEPLAALDYRRRQEILPYLERLHQEVDLPILYVTHSLEEVTRLADFLVLLERGRVVAQGEVLDLLSRPELDLGSGVEAGAMLAGEVVERDARWHLARVRFDGGELWVRDNRVDNADPAQRQVRLRVLARDVSLSLEPAQRSSILNRLPATVAGIVEASDPALATVQLQLGPTRLLARVSRRSVAELGIETGQSLWAQIKSVAIMR